MSVALIAHYLGPRLGIGQYLNRLLPPLVEELISRGTKVKILASPNAFENTPTLQELADSVNILPPLDYSPAKRYGWVATRFNGYCAQAGVEALVWLSNPIVLPWHPPTIAVLHDVNEWKAANKYGDRIKTALRSLIYLDASIRFAQQIIVVSKATENDLLHFRPNPRLRQKLKTIPNGVDSALAKLPTVSIPAPTGPFLLSVGRIDPAAKRLPEAVALTTQLRELSGEPWELHLVGGMNTSTQASGEAFLKSIESLPWVQYHGHISDRILAQWYREATAVVFLSDREGFGLPIAEAASFGRFVVVSQGNQAGLEAGGSAIITVDPDQPREAAEKVMGGLKEKQLAEISSNLPKWETAAIAYADAINQLNRE
ncbi:glycosyltransferase [Moorena producens PAL-8-15-08-1]|uniref:Glycosyltransferase n=1 Tax=Moorena producens PAL-8-15-08-1 TaxID=1458985 RepID=A0A1D8TRP8_9CYAN|nr:glycosyltransferase [Moorena producens]AOX00106.1 glycosyltransferase [Moorena producens PAL-8-15-08-1]